MFYEVDPAARAKRFFSSKVQYSEIEWSDLDQIVEAYRQRIQDWYLDPARELSKNIHFAFSVMALNCLLIDTLSQFMAGEPSSGDFFKEFIQKRLPATYSRKLKKPIEHFDGKGKQAKALEDMSSVLYHGFRCGILHQAHIPPYGGVVPGSEFAVVDGDYGLVKYKKSGADCPSVMVDPLSLLDDLERAFETYLQDLKDRDPKNDPLRTNFKRKFSVSFGIDISTAA
jgi:hypothetical protein